jgi:PAS domain S-box-containing protein
MSDAQDMPISILLVDGDPAVALAIESALSGLGAGLVRVASGEEALRFLLEVDVAAVLLDVRLPGPGGLETARRIRECERTRGTPIVFLAGPNDEPGFSVREVYALGAVDYLVKPLLPEILRSKVGLFIELFRTTQAAARAASDARERLASVLSTVNDLFLIFDRDLRYTYANDRMVEASGIPRERIVGRTLQEVFPDTSGTLFERELRRALDEQVPVHFEFYHASYGRWFDNRAYPSGDGLVLVTTETTDAKRAEQAIRRQAGMLEAVLSTTVDHVYVFDRQGRYVVASEGAARVVGRTRDELIGKTALEAGIPLEVRQVFEPQRDRVFATGEAELHEISYQAADGLRHFEYIITPVRNERGEIEWVVVVSRDITDRKRNEDRLRESEQRFRLTADHAPVLIWIAGVDKLCRWFNKPWLEFTGRTMEQELGNGWYEGVHPDDLDACIRVYSANFDARTSFKMEYRLRHRSGDYRWVIDQGSPLYAPTGECTGYIGSCVDIHDRKLAEQRQVLLAEAGRILGSSLDYEATLEQVSALVVPGFADWCGLDLLTEDGEVSRLAVVHRDPAKVKLVEEYRRRYPPRPDDPTGLMAVLRRGEPLLRPVVRDDELIRVARDPEHLEMLRGLGLKSFIMVPLIARGRTLGTLTLAIAESSRHFDEDDLALAQALGSRAALAVDNAHLFSEAERSARRTDEALNLHRSVEEQLTLLVDASGSLSASLDLSAVLSAVLDLSSRLIAAHAYAVWRFEPATGGWSIAHSSGLSDRYQEATIRGLAAPGQMPEIPIVAEDVLAVPLLGEREKLYEREGIRSLLAVPLRVRGETTGTLVFYYRTPHRFPEVDLRVATALANLAASAINTAELYGVLMVTNRRKDEFLAMLAHELRNPLAAISNAVQVARRTDDRESREWSQEVIERQVRHLSRLMDDLLDVSRITRGKVALRHELIDIATVLRSAIESVRSLIDERKHDLVVVLPEAPLWLEADATRIEQIVVNLLTNAAKYTESGGRITLTASRDEDDALLSVRDNGVGIPPEALPEMFELFAQGDRTLARSEGGLGIGLTLVKSLAEMHGGSITARSDGPGTGSEFLVRLPAARSGPERRSPEAPPQRNGRPCRRVLIVDDNADTTRGMARLLKLLGHEVHTALDGPSAIAAAQAHRPDYVLLDIGLPGMSGYEVAARIREDQSLRDTVIIAVSGYGQEEDRLRSRQAGIDHHFVKPVDHDVLLKLIVAEG